jgi:hypothetical protein
VRLNYDFHPNWMARQVDAVGLTVQQRYAVSHFRLGRTQGRIDAETLARIDSWLFAAGGTFPLAPSVFLKVGAPAGGVRSVARRPLHSCCVARYVAPSRLSSAPKIASRAYSVIAHLRGDRAFGT